MVAPSPWKMSQPLTWKYGMTILLWTVNGSDDYVHDAVTKKKKEKKRNLLCPCGESGLELAKHCRSKIINSCWYGFEVIRLSTCYCKQKHFISWKRLPNNAVTQQRQSQFTPKMKATMNTIIGSVYAKTQHVFLLPDYWNFPQIFKFMFEYLLLFPESYSKFLRDWVPFLSKFNK